MRPTVWILPSPKVKTTDRFPAFDADANEIALGLLQISALPSGAWNDPTASALDDADKQALADQWGVRSRADWLSVIDHLSTVRLRRQMWMLHLSVRNDLALAAGRVPTPKEWLAAVVAEGGDERDARPFVAGIEQIEHEVRRRVGADIVSPELFVRTLDAYALGQAVAMATWGVALGHADVAEARRIIHRINVDARPSFVSWADFGLSYLAGRVMHWSDGDVDETAVAKFGDGWTNLKSAARRGGPWATLPWRAPVDADSSPHRG